MGQMPELLDDTRFEATEPAPAGSRPAAAPGRVSERTRRLARRDLRRQIGALERELAELFASAFPRRGVEFSVPGGGGPRVLDVPELERIRDALAARVQDVRSWLSERGYVEERNREFLEELIAEPQRFPWVRVSNDGHRRAGMPPLALAPALGPDRDADGLVARQALLGLPVSHLIAPAVQPV